MKDETYFDGSLFAFTNKELLNDIKIVAKEEKVANYIIVDEALREFMSKKLNKTYTKPKVPRLS
jgi:predicted nucleotidyltransferase